MSEIKSNENLSNVMNSMSDKQVYGLLASGVINSDLVNEYIKNGANAPILACGTSDCEVGDLKYVFEEADRDILEQAVRWVIITIIFVFDPLAVLLLIASQYTFEWRRKDGTNLRPMVESTPTIYCLLYTSPSPRDRQKSRMPSSA